MGVDEVGRGSVAGPVVVGAVVFADNCKKIIGIKDSKKLSRKQRERLEPKIKKWALAVGIGQAEPDEIDKNGIIWGLNKAAELATRQVIKKIKVSQISIDGPKTMGLEKLGIKVIPIIDGDEKIYEIAAASIVAKVYRDKLLRKLAKKYSGYGWETNVGYGTKKHVEAIKKLGLTPFHRKTFWHG